MLQFRDDRRHLGGVVGHDNNSRSRHLIRARFTSELSSGPTDAIENDGDGVVVGEVAGSAEFGMTVELERASSAGVGMSPSSISSNLGIMATMLAGLLFIVV